MAAKDDPVLSALKKASKGLTFPSESEAEIEPFAWKGGAALTAAKVLECSGSAAGIAIDKTTLDELWHTIPSADRGRFQALRTALETQLKDVAVYQIGDEAEKTVFIVGSTSDGRWAGVKTAVVET